LIEIFGFKLRPAADEAAFMAVDKRLQAEFAYQQPGLMRRTTARGTDGDWVVIDLWRSEADAERTSRAWGNDPLTAEFTGLIDPDTVLVRRYHELD
jgi:hypothetical protein